MLCKGILLPLPIVISQVFWHDNIKMLIRWGSSVQTAIALLASHTEGLNARSLFVENRHFAPNSIMVHFCQKLSKRSSPRRQQTQSKVSYSRTACEANLLFAPVWRIADRTTAHAGSNPTHLFYRSCSKSLRLKSCLENGVGLQKSEFAFGDHRCGFLQCGDDHLLFAIFLRRAIHDLPQGIDYQSSA
jgi:hypothetical protein